MKRMPRNINEKGFFHVMVQGINKKYIFEKAIDKEDYLSLLMRYKNKFKIILCAYCIMDNHAHLLIYTDEIYELSKYMAIVNSRFAQNFNSANERVGYVFRDRFNSQYIDTNDYLLKCLNYIHMNPVSAGIVKQPQDYKYSSYTDYLNKKGIVNEVVIEKIFNNIKDYITEFNNISNEEIEIMDIDREEENFMVAVRNYLKIKNTDLNTIKNDNTFLFDFCNCLIIKKKYKQVQVARLLKIDVKRICYIIKKLNRNNQIKDN